MSLKLHLGCGRDIRKGYVNVDRRKLKGVDVVLDIERDEWPWEENSVDFILAYHVLEHLGDLIGFMDKAHKVLKPTGQLHVRVPHHRHRNADTDPTHVRRFTESSFDYWYPGTSFESFSDLQWKCKHHRVIGGKRIPFLKYIYLLPPHEIRWVLSPIKPGVKM